ncbi:MAG: hypothetical protein JNJ54_08070 [Myxococcaceae bacterium]|nr:hypothetical protein [Myxococcaceae bacterium]
MTDEDVKLPPLPPELAALRDVGAPLPPSGFEERVGSRLAESLASLGAGAASATAGATAAASGAVVATGKLVVGAVLVLTTGVGLGVAVDRVVLRPEVQPPAPGVGAPPAPVAAPPAEPPVAAPPAVDVTPALVGPDRPAVKPDPRPDPKPDLARPSGGRDVSLAAERALLEVARAALAKGDTVHALEALERHQREHAQGRLREEREALFIEGLRAAGRDQEAEARREKFLREFPESLLAP